MVEMNRLYITGPSCSGKSTLARYIAEKYNLSYRDLDDEIEAYACRPIADIFATDGEAAFRRMESEMLRASDTAVTATGGGTVLDLANVRYMWQNKGKVVLLIASPEILAQRLDASYERPLIQGDRLKTLDKMLRVRAYAYCMADQVIDTGFMSVEQSAKAVLGQ